MQRLWSWLGKRRYHRRMPRSDVYLKVVLDLEEAESPQRLAEEICRAIRKIYGVRLAEVSNIVEQERS